MYGTTELQTEERERDYTQATGERGGGKVLGRGGGVRRHSRASLTAASELSKFSNAVRRFWTGTSWPSGLRIAPATEVSSREKVRCCLEARRMADRCKLSALAEGRLGQESGRRRFAGAGEESGETRSRNSSSSEEEEAPAASSSAAASGRAPPTASSTGPAISSDLRFGRRGEEVPVAPDGATAAC